MPPASGPERGTTSESTGGRLSTRPSTHSVHTLSYYKNKYKILPEEMPNSLIASECSISLPIYNGMTEQEQDYVIKKVTEHKI